MSTDHQRYSIDNQSALIRAYAHANGMQVVQTYVDRGRSGLTLRERPGLSGLLSDVLAGRAMFEAVLVYDVSRWGRFQDADESAHYEFLCRRAGIRVIYCAEQFSADGTPFAGVLKALKRAMAGEYSRELSVRVAAGKARLGGLGFRVGGIAGYGLRRQILENGSTPSIVLGDRQRKSIQTDRVTLVPGPLHEVQLVRRIYRDYIYRRRSERQISAELNAEGLKCFGRAWSRNLVRTILSNEKYIGNNIVGQFCQRLCTPKIVNPPETWIRCDRAFEAIVPAQVFEAAACVRRFNEKTYLSADEILAALSLVLAREGKLTAAIINCAAETPSANTVEHRFGSLSLAYEKIGYLPAARYLHHGVNRALREVRRTSEAGLIEALRFVAGEPSRTPGGLITYPGGGSIEVLVCRCQQPRSYLTGWRVAYQRNLGASMLVAVRMKPGNRQIRDLLLIPSVTVSQLPVFLRELDDPLIARFRHATWRNLALALPGVG